MSIREPEKHDKVTHAGAGRSQSHEIYSMAREDDEKSFSFQMVGRPIVAFSYADNLDLSFPNSS